MYLVQNDKWLMYLGGMDVGSICFSFLVSSNCFSYIRCKCVHIFCYAHWIEKIKTYWWCYYGSL